MRIRFALTVALLALAACEATDTFAPYEESTDFELVVADAPIGTSSGSVAMGGADTLKFIVPEDLLGDDVHPVYQQILAPFQMSVSEDTVYITLSRIEPSDDGGSTIGRAGGGGGGAIGTFEQDAEGPLLAPDPIHSTVFAQLGALLGAGQIRGVVGLSTVDLRPAAFGNAEGICLRPLALVTVLADARSIAQTGLPGGSYRVPVTASWSVTDSTVVGFDNTWGEDGAEFARIQGASEGETVLRASVSGEGSSSDDIPVSVSSNCPA